MSFCMCTRLRVYVNYHYFLKAETNKFGILVKLCCQFWRCLKTSGFKKISPRKLGNWLTLLTANLIR